MAAAPAHGVAHDLEILRRDQAHEPYSRGIDQPAYRYIDEQRYADILQQSDYSYHYEYKCADLQSLLYKFGVANLAGEDEPGPHHKRAFAEQVGEGSARRAVARARLEPPDEAEVEWREDADGEGRYLDPLLLLPYGGGEGGEHHHQAGDGQRERLQGQRGGCVEELGLVRQEADYVSGRDRHSCAQRRHDEQGSLQGAGGGAVEVA